ncbi:MAG: S8 family serine peptidase [Methylobacterium frigidaeris]
MIATRTAPGLQPLSADVIAKQFEDVPDIEVVRTIRPPRPLVLQGLGLFSPASSGTSPGPIICAKMAVDQARLLQAQAAGGATVEHDAPLLLTLDAGAAGVSFPNPGVVVPQADGFRATIEVRGASGPLEGADVYVFGSIWPVQGLTDSSGRATLGIAGEGPETIRALYVKPKLDHWSLWLERPGLTPGGVDVVEVKPLGDSLHGFPAQPLVGWGERAMGLDRLPPNYDGAGVKVAIIDSGAAQPTHRNLRRVGPGLSVVGPDRKAWTDDTIGHGSHCAGIIGGNTVANGGGIRGFAPAAEIHICRIFPGGRFSDLVAALDYCMEAGVDVVNMSLGGGEPSQIIEERIIRAKEMGIACIVAAGNSGGPVQFPASLPQALAVSAVGKWGEFPADSYHATQAIDGFESRDGYFPAKFSCFGPEVDVCAPGVAIVSSLPVDGFAAWDGTSMATPHVTGLAALVLAHHPDFRTAFAGRDARRVERLFQIIKSTARPLNLGDPGRTGAGLPWAPSALGLEAAIAPLVGNPAVSPESIEALRRLLALVAGGSGNAAGDGAAAPQGSDPRQAAGPGRIWFNPPVRRGPTESLSPQWLPPTLDLRQLNAMLQRVLR